MKLSQRLMARLKAEFGYDVIEIERVFRGCNGKAAGTWAWTAKTVDGLELGSEDTMAQCVAAKKLHLRRPPWERAGVLHVDAEQEQKYPKELTRLPGKLKAGEQRLN